MIYIRREGSFSEPFISTFPFSCWKHDANVDAKRIEKLTSVTTFVIPEKNDSEEIKMNFVEDEFFSYPLNNNHYVSIASVFSHHECLLISSVYQESYCYQKAIKA